MWSWRVAPPTVCRLLTVSSIGAKSGGGAVTDILLERIGTGKTEAGSSNGGTLLSSRASQSAAAQTAFSVSQDAARSKLCSRRARRIEWGRKPAGISKPSHRFDWDLTLGDIDELKNLEGEEVLWLIHLALLDPREYEIPPVQERGKVLDFDRRHKRRDDWVMVEDVERPDKPACSQRLKQGWRDGRVDVHPLEYGRTFNLDFLDAPRFVGFLRDSPHGD